MRSPIQVGGHQGKLSVNQGISEWRSVCKIKIIHGPREMYAVPEERKCFEQEMIRKYRCRSKMAWRTAISTAVIFAYRDN